MQELVGRTLLHRYRVESFIGSGAAARVYKVWDAQRSAHLAMKLLREELGRDDAFLRAFELEARALAHLDHPHIVRFYSLERELGLAFMLMEYIDGVDLRQRLRRYRVALLPHDALQIITPVCSALAYAHSYKVVHCDIKPANILIDSRGRVLLTDFGIVRLTASGAEVARVGAGTPAYMAPEQIEGKSHTPETDIYALGIVLFEVLTGGSRPFTGSRALVSGSVADRLRWEQVHLPPPSPREYNPALPAEIEAIVLTCLEKEPGRRYSSAMALATELQRAIHTTRPLVTGHPLRAPASRLPVPRAAVTVPSLATDEPRSPSAAIRTRRRLPAWAWGGAVAVISLLTLAAVVVGTGWSSSILSSADRLTATETLRHNARVLDVSWSPDSMLLATAGEDGSVSIWDGVSGTLENTLQAHANEVWTVAWSPDGTRLASADTAGTIILWNAATGEAQLRLEGHADWVNRVAWSPDSARLASVSDDHRVIIWDSLQAHVVQFLDGHTDAVEDVAWSPDGRMLASAGDDNRVIVWDVASGTQLRTLPHDNWVGSVAWSPDGRTIASGTYGTAILWDAATGQQVRRLVGQAHWITGLAFSPDGARLAMGTIETVVIWDNDTGHVLQTLKGHGGWVTCVAWSPDGRRLASGSQDQTVIVWASER